MKYNCPENIVKLAPYVPITHHPEVRMDANEGCFPIDKGVLEKFREELGGFDFNRYPDPSGTEVCKNFADFYGVDPKHVALGNGSDELLSIIIGNMVGEDQKLLIFTPDFSMYQFYADLNNVEFILVDKPQKVEEFTATFIKDEIAKHNPSVVLFSNPCNPTSYEISVDEVKEVLNSTEALVVLDEAYMDFGTETFLPYYRDFDNLIILKTASKGIGFANARLGFFVSNDYFVDIVKKIKSPYNVNGITQLLGKIIFEDKASLQSRIDLIISERDKMYNRLSPYFQISKPSGNFMLAKVENGVEIKEGLLEKGISIKAFPGGVLRITVGTPEENERFIEALIDLKIIEG